MLDIIKSGGVLIIPIILCSVLAFAIVVERFFALKKNKVIPPRLMSSVWKRIKNKRQFDANQIKELQSSSPLGRVVAAGIVNANHSREATREAILDVANHEVHSLGRFLNPLGTIASITPLLGLLGTVVGMIKVFTVLMQMGPGNASVLAGGISEALITTAAGLTVAIPALIFHRHFLRKIEDFAVSMEKEAMKLVDVLHGQREMDA